VLSPPFSRHVRHKFLSHAVEAASAHHGLRRHVQSQHISSGSCRAISFIHIHTLSVPLCPSPLSFPLASSPSLGIAKLPRISELPPNYKCGLTTCATLTPCRIKASGREFFETITYLACPCHQSRWGFSSKLKHGASEGDGTSNYVIQSRIKVVT